ncbi:sugar phosphate isomerase/epimerase [Microbispora sp. GKU 823]|uniref:sugar phosphate isomerase/epimerase family protein n=1 Tax=Microbispora sp. GKU 823 TaxID=1652100 RepID=UPI0009A31776|nr:sugar phosphate isomerase/epimerase [Microbispora sp. GKU 823]OPG08966.1 sugar phosphate isomerase [Microbispora sp. GKU 823]
MTDIRWGYALNQWKPQFDDFVRREQHERALKTVSIAGFEGVELTAGTGRWEPLGNPRQLIANFGSLTGFREFLSDCGIAAVPSWFYDPQQRSMEHLTPPYSPLVAADVAGIVTRAEWFADALAQLDGSVLVVRAAPSAGDVGPLDDAALRRLADCWTAVGRATLAHGVRTALHVDFLSPLRRPGTLDRLLGLADPAAVGLAVDTAELTVAGLDPVEVIRRHPGRIWHVQYKDALAADTDEEYLQPHAEYSVRQRGGSREIPRWFAEPGAHGGLVDFAAVTRALLGIGYAGWVVFESDQSPHPATSALLGGYLLQRELRPMVTAA